MKTRILASIIITGILASSAVQAGEALSIEETYSGALPSQVNDMGLGSYYVAPRANKPTCGLRAAEYDLDPLRVVYTDQRKADSSIDDYLTVPHMQLVCSSDTARS